MKGICLFKKFIFAFSGIFLFFNLNITFSQDNTTLDKKKLIKESSDSLKTTASDSLSSASATYTFYNPLVIHGSAFLLTGKPAQELTKQSILNNNYTALSDIFRRELSAFPLLLGNAGMFNSFSFYGALPKDISYMFNGRRLNDLEYGSLNMEQIPVEFIERFELIRGSEAVVLSGASGAMFNLQEIRYNTSVPYTRLWYSQAGYEFLASDGVFSQNFAPNWNLTLGFRGMSSLGRFQNSWLDSWNLRGLVRWNLSERTSISLSENFVNHGIGTNGGIDPGQSPVLYDEISAVVNYASLNERTFRHDLTLTMTSMLDEDSTRAFTSSVYLTNTQRDINRPPEMMLGGSDTTAFLYYGTSFFGGSAVFEQRISSFLFFKTGGSADYCNVSKTPYFEGRNELRASGFGHIRFILPIGAELSGGARLDYQFTRTALSIGARLSQNLGAGIDVFADLSVNERLPNLVEGIHLKKEAHLLALAEISYNAMPYSISLTGFIRRVQDPIIAEPLRNNNGKVISTRSDNSSDMTVVGGDLKFKALLFDFLGFEGTVSGYIDRLNNKEHSLFPNFSAKGTAYYKIKVGRSELKAGVTGSLQSSFNGFSFFSVTRTYYPYESSLKLTNTGLDVFLIARLDEVYVRAELQNALSQGYYTVPIYPAMDMNFRLTLSWAFMD